METLPEQSSELPEVEIPTEVLMTENLAGAVHSELYELWRASHGDIA